MGARLPVYVIARAAAAAAPRRRRLKRAPIQLPPLAAERALQRSLRPLIELADRLVAQLLIPRLPGAVAAAEASRPTADDALWRREDDYDDLIRRLLEALRAGWLGGVPDRYLSDLFRGAAQAVSRHQRAQHQKVLRAVLGVDILSAEPWLEAELKAFVTQNVALIKSVAASYFDDVERIVFAGVRSGLRHEAIAQQLKERLPRKYRARAELIARDQVNKLNGQLAMLRQRQAGVSRYTWRSVHDARVRPSHRALDGRVFSWDSPPLVDGERAHPGQPIACRCYAEPLLSELEER